MGIDWNQASTKRGLVWLVGGIVALVFLWFGKDANTVIAVTGSVAGGLGVALKD